MPRIIEEIEFRNPSRARDQLNRLAGGLPEVIVLERLRIENPGGFDRLSNSPTALSYLITIFSYSKFLSETVLRYPEWLLQLVVSGKLHHVLSAEEYEDRLAAFLLDHGTGPDAVPPPIDLARFRRQQLLRIVLRDVLGLGSLADVTEELSNLADAVLDLTYRRIRAELVLRHGTPQMMDAHGRPRECGLSVIALGKLGGRELNYSSDIDLMFVYSGAGETNGPQPISTKEFFKKIANRYTELLSTYTPEGQCYRVDLRLRPDGRLGEVCISLEGAVNYYKHRARDWELQMLIKARVSAGEPDTGRELLEFVEPLIYSTTLDFHAVEAVSETRARIHEKLAAKKVDAGLDIKLTRGGIRDIEFLVQCLQRLHGGREAWVRHGGTLFALFRLRDKSLLSGWEYARLASAYQFLRNLEHRLQFDEDRQTHTLTDDPEALEILARRMPASANHGIASADTLARALDDHLEEVQELYERVIHAQRPMYYSPAPPEDFAGEIEPTVEEHVVTASNLMRFLDQRAPRLAQVLNQANLRRGRDRFEHFLEKMLVNPEWLEQLNSNSRLADCAIDLFEHSQYFADQLIRHPELLDEVSRACDSPEFQLDSESPDDSTELRRFYTRQMLRIQCQSVFLRTPIFDTLAHTSDLADAVIAAAYHIALEDTKGATPPSASSYKPVDQMVVIALGRLGMREFDLASDADLVFVLPDADSSEQLFWTRVAERMIHVISAYTGQGVIFTVDTRLRPNGREGALVQSESGYKDYFSKRAEAWEGIAYMKSRGVAGNIARATDFLHELQDVDWRRYGQSGRSRKELAQMRARLEKEQGVRNPLKAGRGGYYDIDFVLMYLRLKGAGIFYKVLNTPARIDVIEKMGHLDREDAEFLRDTATFYRAVDHGLRISAGHAEGNLPSAPEQTRVLRELADRWTPEHLHDRSLDAQLARIREGTRQFFDRIFG
ncbi:MAG: glutamine-synthetase adenylyltransferase [Acidobacteria bacterium]|nr:MAG: glutamine-synthetase adenylyltransferase [Acidobacteriota bacterium]